jgi:hypothetical protein
MPIARESGERGEAVSQAEDTAQASERMYVPAR